MGYFITGMFSKIHLDIIYAFLVIFIRNMFSKSQMTLAYYFVYNMDVRTYVYEYIFVPDIDSVRVFLTGSIVCSITYLSPVFTLVLALASWHWPWVIWLLVFGALEPLVCYDIVDAAAVPGTGNW